MLGAKDRIESAVAFWLDGKDRIESSVAYLLDGKDRIESSVAYLLDGKDRNASDAFTSESEVMVRGGVMGLNATHAKGSPRVLRAESPKSAAPRRMK